MGNTSSRSEADLAKERNEQLQRCLKARRLHSVLLSGLFLVSALIVGVYGFAIMSFCLLVLSIIFLLRYFDTNGHLHEVRRRSTKTLFPRISLLHRKDQSASTEQGQSLAQQ